MKDKKKVSIIYYFAAVCFYIAAIICFINGSTTQGIIMLCLGSSQLCLGSVWLNKNKRED